MQHIARSDNIHLISFECELICLTILINGVCPYKIRLDRVCEKTKDMRSEMKKRLRKKNDNVQ